MCSYNYMVNAFSQIDGHMFCSNPELFFVKYLIRRNKHQNFLKHI